jgi:2-dehydro-3-deoxyphosphogluconate aldolase / (4S)-4-hydroxy-2-oxoglutarate aldolase
MDQVLSIIGKLALVPVITIEDDKFAIPLAQALLAGGLPCIEITFRTDAAERSIHRITSSFPDMVTGAGTILSIEQAEKAKKAGAKFIVSPGFDSHLVDWCREQGISVIPGVATPTEIGLAHKYGLFILKFFPAEAFGGIATLKAISAPYRGIRFIPTGGINTNNLCHYLRLPSVYACGGSWIAPPKLISSGSFEEITKLTREALDLIRKCRNQENEL